MTPTALIEAVALAAGIEALSTGHVLVLAARLRAILEAATVRPAPVATPTPARDDAPPPSGLRSRALSSSPDAVRARARRASRASDDARQMDLPMVQGGGRGPNATAVATAVERTQVSGSPWLLANATAVATAVSSTTTDQINDQEKKTGRSRGRSRPASTIDHDPEQLPPWASAAARALRPDLPEPEVRTVWWFFATKTRRHPSEDHAAVHFGRWLARHVVRARPELDTPAPSAPASSPRPRPVLALEEPVVEPVAASEMARFLETFGGGGGPNPDTRPTRIDAEPEVCGASAPEPEASRPGGSRSMPRVVRAPRTRPVDAPAAWSPPSPVREIARAPPRAASA